MLSLGRGERRRRGGSGAGGRAQASKSSALSGRSAPPVSPETPSVAALGSPATLIKPMATGGVGELALLVPIVATAAQRWISFGKSTSNCPATGRAPLVTPVL